MMAGVLPWFLKLYFIVWRAGITSNNIGIACWSIVAQVAPLKNTKARSILGSASEASLAAIAATLVDSTRLILTITRTRVAESENDRCGSANAVGVKGNDSAPSATDDVDDRDLRVGASFFITIFLLLVVAGVYWCLLARLADPNLRKSANPETKESDKGASKN